MTVNPPAAYGMYSYDKELHQVVHTLNQSGFDNEDICMMVSPRHPIATFVREANILNAERKEDTIAEQFMGWLFEFGAVVIPTVGFFIRSRIFLHALVASGNSGCLAGLGFSERDAARFEKQLREMGVMVYVACAESANAAWAVEILRRTGAKEPGLLEQEAFLEAAVA
jgi:Heat induced stress protein YflT